jgi:GTP-binding protein
MIFITLFLSSLVPYTSRMSNHSSSTNAMYIKSINGTDDILKDSKPKICFLGRSNVGKSTLINSILGKSLARSSATPGKTITIDFFLIQQSMYFVDLPGYGFAKRSKEKQEHFRKLIAWYLFRSGVIHKLVVLIIDANIGVTDFDQESISLLTSNKIPFVIVANKIDKMKMGIRHKQLLQIQTDCGNIPVIPYSSVSQEGRKDLMRYIIEK